MNTPDRPASDAPDYFFPHERVEMVVKTIAMDTDSKNPVMILTDRKEYLYLPIWVGPFEGNAIKDFLESKSPTRPMTYDMFKSVLVYLKWRVSETIICDLQDQTYFARLTLGDESGNTTTLDSRPSDAIALAIRFKAPIFVNRAVIDAAVILDKGKLHIASIAAGGPVPIE